MLVSPCAMRRTGPRPQACPPTNRVCEIAIQANGGNSSPELHDTYVISLGVACALRVLTYGGNVKGKTNWSFPQILTLIRGFKYSAVHERVGRAVRVRAGVRTWAVSQPSALWEMRL